MTFWTEPTTVYVGPHCTICYKEINQFIITAVCKFFSCMYGECLQWLATVLLLNSLSAVSTTSHIHKWNSDTTCRSIYCDIDISKLIPVWNHDKNQYCPKLGY